MSDAEVGRKTKNMMSIDECGSELPEEVLEEILSRVDAEYLCSYKSASKELLTLLTSKSFKLNHLRNMKSLNSPMFLFQEEICYFPLFYHVSEKRDFEVVRLVNKEAKDFDVLGAAGSLILYCNEADDFYLLNSITNEKNMLPRCDIRFPTGATYAHVLFGMGYLEEEDDYKIVRVALFNTNNFKSYVNVYSKKMGLWISTADFPKISHRWKPGVFVCGRVHWRTTTSITTYNFKDGTFTSFDMPKVSTIYDDQDLISLDDETLALSCSVYTDVYEHTIWILKDYSNKASWEKVDVSFEGTAFLNMSFHLQPIYVLRPNRSEIIIRLDPLGCFGTYNIDSHVWSDLESDEIVETHMASFRFIPSFHSPDPSVH